MKYIVVIIVLLLFILLFKKAAGTLKLNKINVISFVFYSLLFFEVIGMCLIFLGYNNHYLIQKISNKNIIEPAFYSFAYTILSLPLTIYLFNKYIYKIDDVEKEYNNNIEKKVVLENQDRRNRIFICVLIGLIISLLSTIYVFKCIGYVPLFKYFDNNFNFSTARIENSRNFIGNEYIKNIFMVLLTPLYSYISYIYYKTSNEKKWKILFIISFVLSIFTKTYNFEKAPLIYFVCYFFLIKVLLGETSKLKRILPFVLSAVILIIGSYIIIGNYQGNILTLSSGPLSRIIMTQAGTLLLHFDAFPVYINYLYGSSFSKVFALIFGTGKVFGVRSGRLLMEYYNKNAILNGTGGVMSTMFLGEAYANFGIYGILFSPILVGIIFSSIFCIYLKNKKTPLNMVLYIECLIIFTTVLQAGFVDFIYNISFVVIFLVVFAIKFISVFDLKLGGKKHV